MRGLCACLSERDISLPRFTSIAVGKVITLLGDKQCNIALFRDIQLNIYSLLAMLRKASPAVLDAHEFGENDDEMNLTGTVNSNRRNVHDELVARLLPITEFVSGLAIPPRHLMQESQSILNKIQSSIAAEGIFDPCTVDKNGLIPNEFFRRNEEELRGKMNVNHPVVVEMYRIIDNAAHKLCEAVKNNHRPDVLEVSLDLMDNSIFYTSKKLSIKSASTVSATKLGDEYIPFIDRKGKEASKRRVTTAALREALNKYLVLVDQATLKIATMLQTLSEEINESKFTIIQVPKPIFYMLLC